MFSVTCRNSRQRYVPERLEMNRKWIVLTVALTVSWPGFVETLEAQQRLSLIKKTFRAGEGPTQVVAVDLNKDKNLDLVVANGRG